MTARDNTHTIEGQRLDRSFRRRCRLRLVSLAMAWCLLGPAHPGRAVGASVQNQIKGTQHDSIQEAINSADDGDILVAAPGTYAESVSFMGKAITLRSQDPNDPGAVAATLIKGDDVAAVSFTHGEGPRSILAGFVVSDSARGILCSGAMPTIFNCRIVDNTGFGIAMMNGSAPTLVNCIIAGNASHGIDLEEGARAFIDHCTIVGNPLAIVGGSPIVTNSILWDNSFDGIAPPISGGAVVTYSNVQGGYEGEGNIDELPRFVEPGQWANPRTPEAAWVRGNYHLFSDSPCVDAGDPAFVPIVLTTDIDGHARIIGSRTDMGCDEVPQPIYVTWLGHASVRIAWKGLVVYVDPYRLTASPQDADLILITHSHSDHYSPSDIARVRKAQTQFVAPPDVVKALGVGNSLAPGQSVEILGLIIDGVASYNITKTNHPKANNWLGFVVNIGSNRIYCAGDTDLTPEMKALTDIDLAFLPAGGTYTMDATEAAQATRFIQPTLAVPYHWGTATGSIADAEQFARLATDDPVRGLVARLHLRRSLDARRAERPDRLRHRRRPRRNARRRRDVATHGGAPRRRDPARRRRRLHHDPLHPESVAGRVQRLRLGQRRRARPDNPLADRRRKLAACRRVNRRSGDAAQDVRPERERPDLVGLCQ